MLARLPERFNTDGLLCSVTLLVGISLARRPPIVMPVPRPAASPMGGGAVSSGAASSAASERLGSASYDGSHAQDLAWYRDVLQMSLADKSITPDEDEMLAAVRSKLHISAEDHAHILQQSGWTTEEFEGIRKGACTLEEGGGTAIEWACASVHSGG